MKRDHLYLSIHCYPVSMLIKIMKYISIQYRINIVLINGLHTSQVFQALESFLIDVVDLVVRNVEHVQVGVVPEYVPVYAGQLISWYE